MAEALLVLEDGTQWRGVALGAQGTRAAEVVFNTSLTGYQEVLSDPSYYGQIVAMTAAQIGNTGINRADMESARAWLSAFAVRDASRITSNWRADESLDAFLRAQNIVGISALDTRGLVRHLRTRGVLRGVLSSEILDARQLHQLALDAPDMNGADLVRYVTCDEPYPWNEKADAQWYEYTGNQSTVNSKQYHIIAYDYGIKYNILRLLTARGCRVTVVPAHYSAEDVLALQPDGIFLSNGPGDPAAVTYAIENIRALIGRKPIFGICLGHQIVALALGARTYKLKFGHRGANQPVKNFVTGNVEITTHNHGFAVRAESLPLHVEITHLNLNDDCVEGLRAPSMNVLAAQFHPESAAGTHDALGLFDEFIKMMSS